MAKCHTMKSCCQRGRGMLLPCLTFFMGMTLGFLISPAKHGFGNNSGNITNHYHGKDQPADITKKEASK